MDLKAALTKLKSGGSSLSMPFFFCEADAKGKPVVIVGPVTSEVKIKVLSTAKVKKVATGKMSLGDDGTLNLKATGAALSKVTKGVATAALDVGARSLFKIAVLGEPDKGETPESEQDTEGKPQPSKTVAKTEKSPKEERGMAQKSYMDGSYQTDKSTQEEEDEKEEDGSDGEVKNYIDTNYGKTDKSKEDNEDESESGDKNYFDTDYTENSRKELEQSKKKEDEGQEKEDEDKDKKEDGSGNGGKPNGEGKPPVPKRNFTLGTGPAKQFPDVLRQSPALAKLMDERDALRKKLDQIANHKKIDPQAKQQAFDLAYPKLQAIEGELEKAQKGLNKTGMVPQQMRPEYEGEDKKTGWVTRDKPVMPEIDPNWDEEKVKSVKADYERKMEKWTARSETAVNIRKNFSVDEKANSVMSVNDEGRVVDPKGNPVNSPENGEYVMDKNGKMHQFKPGIETGKTKVLNENDRKVPQIQRIHHTSVLSGEEVGGAGGIDIKDGEVQSINNVSGHYKPGVGPMLQTVEALLKQGALLDQKWVDKDGQPLSGKVLELHSRVKALQKKVAQKLKDDPNVNVTADRTNIDKALEMLSKLGAGPSNKIKGAKVGFLDIKEGMDGPEIKSRIASVNKNTVTAEEFLRTGGGNKEQAGAKSDMQEEIKQKTAERRQRLDEMGSTPEGGTYTGEGTAGPKDSDIENWNQKDEMAGKEGEDIQEKQTGREDTMQDDLKQKASGQSQEKKNAPSGQQGSIESEDQGNRPEPQEEEETEEDGKGLETYADKNYPDDGKGIETYTDKNYADDGKGLETYADKNYQEDGKEKSETENQDSESKNEEEEEEKDTPNPYVDTNYGKG